MAKNSSQIVENEKFGNNIEDYANIASKAICLSLLNGRTIKSSEKALDQGLLYLENPDGNEFPMCVNLKAKSLVSALTIGTSLAQQGLITDKKAKAMFEDYSYICVLSNSYKVDCYDVLSHAIDEELNKISSSKGADTVKYVALTQKALTSLSECPYNKYDNNEKDILGKSIERLETFGVDLCLREPEQKSSGRNR